MIELEPKIIDELVDGISNLKNCDFCTFISETKKININGIELNICKKCKSIRDTINRIASKSL